MFTCLILSIKTLVKTRSIKVKAPSVSDLDNVSVEALSVNEKAT